MQIYTNKDFIKSLLQSSFNMLIFSMWKEWGEKKIRRKIKILIYFNHKLQKKKEEDIFDFCIWMLHCSPVTSLGPAW